MGWECRHTREQIDKYEFNTADKRIAVYPSPETRVSRTRLRSSKKGLSGTENTL